MNDFDFEKVKEEILSRSWNGESKEDICKLYPYISPITVQSIIDDEKVPSLTGNGKSKTQAAVVSIDRKIEAINNISTLTNEEKFSKAVNNLGDCYYALSAIVKGELTSGDRELCPYKAKALNVHIDSIEKLYNVACKLNQHNNEEVNSYGAFENIID